MPFKGIYYLLLAVVVGAVAVFSIHRVVSMNTGVKAEASGKVVIAEADINSGTLLTPRLVKAADWPQRIIPSKAAQNPQQIEGRVTLVPLAKGEPILLNKLAPEGTAAGLGGLLNEEMRAFTVKVDDVSGVAGFLSPGDHVDVLMNMPISDTRSEHLSKIILQDIKVLTAGQVWEQTSDSKPRSVNTVTLEVTPEQSEVLNLASTQGRIRLTLRSRANKVIKATNGVATSQLTNGYVNNGKASSVTEPERPRKTVEMIKGMERKAASL